MKKNKPKEEIIKELIDLIFPGETLEAMERSQDLLKAAYEANPYGLIHTYWDKKLKSNSSEGED